MKVFTFVLRFSCQTDLVDQNLLNFLPTGEHSDVYKVLSTHPTDSESLGTDFLKSECTFIFHQCLLFIFKHSDTQYKKSWKTLIYNQT